MISANDVPTIEGKRIMDHTIARVHNIVHVNCCTCTYFFLKQNVESINWEVMFNNKSIHKQISAFNETLMNIFLNFAPTKLVTFDDRDPMWMNDYVKGKIELKNPLYKIYAKNGYKCNNYFQVLETLNVSSSV